MAPTSMVMRAMPGLVTMVLPRTRRSNQQQRRNNRNQRQLQNVFHVKSPDS
jgi:hypothetical protein